MEDHTAERGKYIINYKRQLRKPFRCLKMFQPTMQFFFFPRIFLVKHVHQPCVDLSPSALEKATSSIVLTVIDYEVYELSAYRVGVHLVQGRYRWLMTLGLIVM